MANAAYAYTDATFVQTGGSNDWDADTLADAAQQLSDAMDMRGTVSKVITVVAVVPDLAISDELVITFLKDDGIGGTQDPSSGNDNFRRFNIPITQNETTKWGITLYARDLDGFVIEMDNQSGQTLTISVSENSSSITPAS